MQHILINQAIDTDKKERPNLTAYDYNCNMPKTKETLKLKIQPRIGQEEEILKSRKQEFRYLVYKNYKVIYWINEKENRIEINDVFDTRQNPTKIKRTK